MTDELADKIFAILSKSDEPLETKEIEDKLKAETRTKIFVRLVELMGKHKIKGKRVGSGKGSWIWWVD